MKNTEIKIQSLPVKYRPKTFSSLIGQQHIVSQLEGMFLKRRLPSAILLTGLPGTGKTTLSRMIARYVNCKDLQKTDKGLEPCGKCSSCLNDSSLNYTEINIADTRGIDDMRALVNASRNQALGGGKRIYCLDEFHQATPAASQCFEPGTLVNTQQGYVKIEDVKEGDYVLSFNHSNKKQEYKKVLASASKSTEEDIYDIETDCGLISVTANHLIWSETRQDYVKAKDLHEGENLKALECR